MRTDRCLVEGNGDGNWIGAIRWGGMVRGREMGWKGTEGAIE